MWKLWMVVPAVAFVALLGMAVWDQEGVPTPGNPAPEFTAPLLIGNGDVSLADLRGKPAVLNFWASWCVPCEDEAPLFKKAHDRFGDRVEFVGIDIRDSRTDALEFIERYDLDYTHVRDEGLRIYDDYGLTGQPETFFIDHKGVVVEHVNGPVSDQTLYELLDILVARDG